MFIGRKKELTSLTKELSSWEKRTAILVYGKHRVGKSTLIKEASRSFNRPMSLSKCNKEIDQLKSIKGIEVSKIGFVCTGGFTFDDNQEFILIDGNILYQN